MYSQISVSMPESTSPKISKFCPGDSGAPIYLEQDGKEVVAGVLSFVEPPKCQHIQVIDLKILNKVFLLFLRWLNVYLIKNVVFLLVQFIFFLIYHG